MDPQSREERELEAPPSTVVVNGVVVADLTASHFALRSPSDVLELVGAGIERLILQDQQLPAEFFDLSTGFAGELVQKCGNYGIKVAVVARGDAGRSTSFRQFARETNRGNRFFFVASIEEGLVKVSS